VTADISPLKPSVRRLVDSSNAATLILNPVGIVWYCNAPLAAMLGVSADDLMGRPFEEVVAPEERSTYRRLLAQARDQASSAGEVGLQAADGELLFAHLALRRLRGAVPERIVVVAVDLTRYQRVARRLEAEKAELEAQVQGRTAELLAANHELAVKQELLQTILEQAADGITVRDADGRLIFINAAAQRRVSRPADGTALEEAPGIWGETHDAEGNRLPAEQWPIGRALRGETVQAEELHRIAADGSRLVVLNSAAPLRDADGQIMGAISISTDITERKRAEEERREIAMFPEQDPHPVLRVSREGVLLYANPASRALLEQWDCRVGGALSAAAWRELVEPLLATERPEVEVACRGRLYSLVCVPFEAEGYLNVYGRDVTERRRVEDRLRQALADKETLLREVHHRTKNNLQMLCDLFYLKAEAVESRETKEALEDGYMRVYAFARLQEQLYLSMEHGVVHLASYLRGIGDGFRQLHREVTMRLELPEEEIHLDLDRTTHCGLLVNELLTNALKHAFPDGRRGEVGLSLRLLGDQVQVVVWDNGVGMGPDVDLEQPKSLGLRIVGILARRIRAAVAIAGAAGTRVTVTFPLQIDE
jgi:PAS domain S-box-containing protein